MNKTGTKPEIRRIHQFLLKTPTDSFPDINHNLFTILALINDGYTQNQIIEALEGRIHRTTVYAFLVKASEKKWAHFVEVEADREWELRFLGKHLLDCYLTVMNKGTIKKDP